MMYYCIPRLQVSDRYALYEVAKVILQLMNRSNDNLNEENMRFKDKSIREFRG